MERKKALAVAATITCVLGSTAVAAASVGGTSILGFGGGSDVRFASVAGAQTVAQSTRIVRRTRDVYDEVVVGNSPASEGPETTEPPPPQVQDPATTTTSAPVTTTTRPPGVPKDWPPDKPIPPVPPNCHHPQLEDNGVWNCEDD